MKLKILIACSLFVTMSISCSKSFLERPDVGTLNEEEALKDEASLQKVLNGAFFMLVSDYNVQVRGDVRSLYGGRLQFMSDLMGDQANGSFYTGDDGEFFNRRTSIFGGYKNEFYTGIYYIINEANRVMGKLDLATNNKDNIEGQARFIRAITHFEMVRLYAQPWGSTANNDHLGIPLRLESSKTALNRSTVKEVYDAIIADLQIAENKLPDAPASGYPSKWAAKALLAKVFFQQNNFAQAFNYADQVIKSNKFQLDATFDKRFSLGLSTEGIFTIKNVTSNLSPGGEIRNRYRSDAGFSPQGRFHMTDVFYNEATATGDLRGTAWYGKTATNNNGLKKYNKDFFDMPIIHLTEIMLIRAEAGAETGVAANVATALGDINTILTRAYGGTSQNLASTSAAGTIIITARKQRELELIGEGNRLQEIKRIGVRTGTSVDRRGAPWNCNGLVLQFPQGEAASNTTFVMNQEGGCN